MKKIHYIYYEIDITVNSDIYPPNLSKF